MSFTAQASERIAAAPQELLEFVLDRWNGITLTGAPRQPGRMVFDFVGTFTCEPTQDGTTKVTHSYDFPSSKLVLEVGVRSYVVPLVYCDHG